MVADKVAKELRSALEAMKAERAELDNSIQDLERLLSKYGVKRGPGRPPGSKNKKKPGRPKKKTASKRGPGRPKGSGKKKTTKKKAVKKNWSPAQRKAAAERMKKIWAERRKKKK